MDDVEILEMCDLARSAASRQGASAADAHDLSQILIEQLFTGDEVFNDLDHMKAWVQRVTKNRAIDQHRARRRDTDYDEDEEIEPQSFSTELVARQKIRDLIDRLPEKYQGVIELTYFAGLPANEVGDELNYSTNTVHKMLSEARSLLRPNITAPPGYEG